MPTIQEDSRHIRIEFEDAIDLKAFLDTFPEEWGNSGVSKCNRSHYFCSFTWEESMTMLESGWSEGVQDIAQIADSIATIMTDDGETEDCEWDVTGDFLDIGRVMEGIPESWGHMELVPQITETVSISVNTGARASVSEDQIYNRGAAITALVDELQKKYFVKIKLQTTASGLTKDVTTIINLDMRQYYSRDLLTFYLANSGYHRRITFAIRELCFPDEKYTGTGGSDEMPKEEQADLHFPIVRSSDYEWDNVNTATAEIKRILTKYNQKQEGKNHE